ncbi:SRY-box containing gene 15 (predicted) [Rattus norvegicus]|uniref:SRY-box containing gene 15 (Predicted) n=1 Tax=Rattus norvegicus TaxID=10116 RepID=A6HFS5_RAT|nr:SRY-box containing gene 15 (predicted) [Rattus norvegicus]|eukprot:NP_001102300.1 protein SOX-15 [Rattus norvegicus]
MKRRDPSWRRLSVFVPATSMTTPTTSTDPGEKAKTRAPGRSISAREEVARYVEAHTGGRGTQLPKGVGALGTSPPTIRQPTCLAVTPLPIADRRPPHRVLSLRVILGSKGS